MPNIALLDYGMGNLHSVAKALEHVGAKVSITSDQKKIRNADKIVFPGVGAMRDCMLGIRSHQIDEALKEALYQKPIMAICVGMQALMQYSEENGGTDCLGIFEGKVSKFSASDAIKIPHMGWNIVEPKQPNHPLWKEIPAQSRFYFVHSYYVTPNNSELIAAITDYGSSFTAAILHENLFATQFHPEKSDQAGLQLLKNFVDWKI